MYSSNYCNKSIVFNSTVHPYRRPPNTTQAGVIIVIIWLLSTIVVTPYMYFLHLNHHASRCEETWNEKQRKTFSVFTFTLQYCIPVVIITFSYSMIVHDLKFRRHPKTSTTSERYKKKENAKLSRLVFIITVTFALCVLPYHCVALWVEFGEGEQYQYIEDVSIIAFFILYLNSNNDSG